MSNLVLIKVILRVESLVEWIGRVPGGKQARKIVVLNLCNLFADDLKGSNIDPDGLSLRSESTL